MKVNAILHGYSADEQFQHIQFPCAGYLKNISLQMISMPASNAITDNWRVLFGELDIQSLKAQSPYTDETLVMSHSRDGNYISVQYMDFEVNTTGGDQVVDYWYHSGNKSITIRSDKVYTLGIFNKLANDIVIILMQAEFQPFKNAYYKQTFVIDTLTASENFAGDFVIPVSLKNAVLEYDIYVDNASEISAWLQPMILRKDYELVTSTGLVSGAGLLDGSINTSGDIRYGGTIDRITIGSAGAGLASSQGVLPIRDIIREGDRLAFDLTEIKGTFSGIKMTITIHGRTIPTPSRFKSQFCESDYLAMIPEEVA